MIDNKDCLVVINALSDASFNENTQRDSGDPFFKDQNSWMKPTITQPPYILRPKFTADAEKPDYTMGDKKAPVKKESNGKLMFEVPAMSSRQIGSSEDDDSETLS